MKKILSFIFVLLVSFSLVACGGQTDAEKLAEAKSELKITFKTSSDNLNSVTGDLNLPLRVKDAKVSWDSNNLDVVNKEGKVVQTDEDVVVELTATLTVGEEKDTKKFTVTVKAEGFDGGGEDEVNLELPEEFNNYADEKKVYIISIGQSGDIGSISSILTFFVFGTDEQDELADKVVIESDKLITASEIPEGSIVILVPGASGKGLGAAGTNVAGEKARAEAFATRAKNGEIKVIVAHLGGEARRGHETDPLITASVDGASLVLVLEEGNSDGFFSALTNEHVYYYETEEDFVAPFKQIFGKE